jgi:hypothetical protein
MKAKLQNYQSECFLFLITTGYRKNHNYQKKFNLKKMFKWQNLQLSWAPWEAEINILIIFFPIFMNESMKDFAILNLFSTLKIFNNCDFSRYPVIIRNKKIFRMIILQFGLHKYEEGCLMYLQIDVQLNATQSNDTICLYCVIVLTVIYTELQLRLFYWVFIMLNVVAS